MAITCNSTDSMASGSSEQPVPTTTWPFPPIPPQPPLPQVQPPLQLNKPPGLKFKGPPPFQVIFTGKAKPCTTWKATSLMPDHEQVPTMAGQRQMQRVVLTPMTPQVQPVPSQAPCVHEHHTSWQSHPAMEERQHASLMPPMQPLPLQHRLPMPSSLDGMDTRKMPIPPHLTRQLPSTGVWAQPPPIKKTRVEQPSLQGRPSEAPKPIQMARPEPQPKQRPKTNSPGNRYLQVSGRGGGGHKDKKREERANDPEVIRKREARDQHRAMLGSLYTRPA